MRMSVSSRTSQDEVRVRINRRPRYPRPHRPKPGSRPSRREFPEDEEIWERLAEEDEDDEDMTADGHDDLDSTIKHHLAIGMRNAGLWATRKQEEIVINTVMPHVRRLTSADRNRDIIDNRTPVAKTTGITRMEYTALVHGAWGWSAERSAQHLGITLDTMKTHRRRLFQRLGTNTIVATVVHALRCGVITMEDIDREP